MQIDASISTNFKDTPSILYGGVGFSWRYDTNYKDVRINIDNKDSDKKPKTKAEKRAAKTKKG
jgi:hypothetical protein